MKQAKEERKGEREEEEESAEMAPVEQPPFGGRAPLATCRGRAPGAPRRGSRGAGARAESSRDHVSDSAFPGGAEK